MWELELNWAALIVFALFFALVTVMGFYASRWKRGDLTLLDEWGLAGRRFGTVITWFLLGGDLYTAYTFIAVPALIFGAGALGFYAIPYSLVAFILGFVFLPRLWAVSKKHDFVTAADFVKARYGSSTLAILIAFTGLLATMPYTALQLVGMEVVFKAMGFAGGGWVGEIPLIIAFVILALYTYSSGMRAPALIAVVKDIMVYVTVFVVVVVLPVKLGSWGHIFETASDALASKTPRGEIVPSESGILPYASLALGSAFALFMYPHAITGVLCAKNGRVVRRNMMLIPLFSLPLVVIALMGYMAYAAGIQPDNPNDVVPLLFLEMFPDGFAGFAFAAISIGALVPAAVMSIAAASLFTRNIYKEYINPNCTPKQESDMAKLVSLIVKFGALGFVLFLPLEYAISLQQLGGVWIVQTLPAIVFGLYTNWFNRWALSLGWLAGMAAGTWMVSATGFKGTMYTLTLFGQSFTVYAAIYALMVNIAVAVALTLVFRALRVSNGRDRTKAEDYVTA